MTKQAYYGDRDGLRVLSCNALLNLIISNRRYGKTWTFKKYIVRRALKKNKRALWFRVFRDEAKECAKTFFESSDLRKYCGLELYDKDTNKNGNFMQNGNTFFIRKKKKNGQFTAWRWFIKVLALADRKKIRGLDDIDLDRIILDEFMLPEKDYKLYRGNPCHDFIDIWTSARREHACYAFLLGNRETFHSPFLTYFNIKAMPSSYEGIKKYRHGTMIIQYINNKSNLKNDFDKRYYELLEGTPYGDFLYGNAYDISTKFKKAKTPPNAVMICQIYMNGQPFKISVSNGLFYVNSSVLNGRAIYCDTPPHKYALERTLVKRMKPLFISIVNAVADNRIYYQDENIHEGFTAFLRWLNV